MHSGGAPDANPCAPLNDARLRSVVVVAGDDLARGAQQTQSKVYERCAAEYPLYRTRELVSLLSWPVSSALGRTFKACARTEAASLIFRCLPISSLPIYTRLAHR